MEVFVQTLVSGLGTAALYLLLSLGLMILFGVLRVVNFAQGDFMTLAAYIGAALVGSGVAVLGTLAVMIPALVAVGLVFYFAILRPTDGRSDETVVLATFGVAYVLQGVVQAIWGADPVAARQDASALTLGGVVVSYDTIRNVLIAAIGVALLLMFFNRVRLGREIRATASDPVGAALLGIDTGRCKLVATLIASGLTATGGLLLFTTTNLYPQVGFALVLTAFAVVIMAGLGSIGGTVVASLGLGIATELVASYVSPAQANAVAFVAIVAVLLVRPSGLSGRTA